MTYKTSEESNGFGNTLLGVLGGMGAGVGTELGLKKINKGLNDSLSSELRDISEMTISEKDKLQEALDKTRHHTKFIDSSTLPYTSPYKDNQGMLIWRDSDTELNRKYPGKQIALTNHKKTNLGVMLHELGHAEEPSNLVSKLIKSKRMVLPAAHGINSLSIIPAMIAASAGAKGEDNTTSALIAGGMGASYLPVMMEEIRASRNAKRLAGNNIKLKGLKRALGTYGLKGIAPLLAGGVVGGTYGLITRPKEKSMLDKLKAKLGY